MAEKDADQGQEIKTRTPEEIVKIILTRTLNNDCDKIMGMLQQCHSCDIEIKFSVSGKINDHDINVSETKQIVIKKEKTEK